MSNIVIPKNYKSTLGLYDTQKAIGLIKTIFQEKLCAALHLKRVTAPCLSPTAAASTMI